MARISCVLTQATNTSAGIEQALATLRELQNTIDSPRTVDHTIQLQQRAWLAHWSLFLFFKSEPGPNMYKNIIDFFMNEKIINTIQTHGPHLLRYLTVAFVCSLRAGSA